MSNTRVAIQGFSPITGWTCTHPAF